MIPLLLQQMAKPSNNRVREAQACFAGLRNWTEHNGRAEEEEGEAGSDVFVSDVLVLFVEYHHLRFLKLIARVF